MLCMLKSKHFNCILATVLAMASSDASGGKTSDRRAVDIECHGCQRLFSQDRRYDQHRRSAYFRGTACYAGPDANKTNVYARRRPKMSTAALDRNVLSVLRTRGTAHRPKNCVYCIFCIFYVFSVFKKIRPGIPVLKLRILQKNCIFYKFYV